MSCKPEDASNFQTLSTHRIALMVSILFTSRGSYESFDKSETPLRGTYACFLGSIHPDHSFCLFSSNYSKTSFSIQSKVVNLETPILSGRHQVLGFTGLSALRILKIYVVHHASRPTNPKRPITNVTLIQKYYPLSYLENTKSSDEK